MHRKNTVKVGIIGLGVVGSAFVRLLETNFKEEHCDIEIVKVAVRNKSASRQCKIDPSLLTDNPQEVVDHPDIKIIIELAGGADKADLILRAIANGKHIITANKSMLAAHGPKIFAAAKQHNVFVGYEASCGGAIPVIKNLRERFTMNSITRLTGIVNGTTNFILDVMEREHKPYAEALKMAQDKGCAESDPTSDVEGYDAAYKLLILSSLAFKSFVSYDQISIRGISQLASEDIAMLAQCGSRIKLLVQATNADDKISLSVRPVVLPSTAIPATIQGAQNYVELEDVNAGKSIFIGEGAGGMPTATAVLQDLVDICRGPSVPAIQAQACGFEHGSTTAIAYSSISDVKEAYCTRVTFPNDSTAVLLEQLTSLFPANTHLFKSGDTFYLLVSNISYAELQSTLLSAMSKNLITSHYAIAVHPSAYSLIEQQSLRWKQAKVLVQDQTMSGVKKTEKSSVQYGGTVFASSLTLVPGTAKVTEGRPRRHSFTS